jgi:glycosyltransferase involved in cell wall biosynthesis
MNICMVSYDFIPNVGGLAAHVRELSKHLVRAGHEVTVVTLAAPGRPMLEEFEGVRIMRCRRALRHTYGAFYILAALRRLRAAGHMDILHAHTLGPDTIVCRLARARARIVTNHTSMFVHGCDSPWRRRLFRHLMSPADGVIAPSQQLAELTCDVGIPAHKVHYVPNGVDTEKFVPRAATNGVRRKHGIPEDALVVLSPRRLVPKNGVEYLVRAAPAVIQSQPKARFLLLGDGPEAANLRSTAQRLGVGDALHFVGTVPNDRMSEYYACADVVAVPSLVEATSIAALEAMASGKPVVSTDVGGLPDVVLDGATGLLVKPRDPAALAGALSRVLQDGNMRRRLGASARRRAHETFGWDTIVKQTHKIYEAAIQERLGAAVPAADDRPTTDQHAAVQR